MPYQREKIAGAIRRASYKRQVSAERLGQIVEEIEEYLVSKYEKEVSSQTIGERIAAVLRRVDKVSYVRFASIYRQFEDVGEFIEEAQDVIERSAEDIPGQKKPFRRAGRVVKTHKCLVIIKQDRTLERFSPPKLRSCLARVIQLGDGETHLADPLAQAVELHLNHQNANEMPTSEYIFHCVSSVLQQTGLSEAALALSAHRRSAPGTPAACADLRSTSTDRQPDPLAQRNDRRHLAKYI